MLSLLGLDSGDTLGEQVAETNGVLAEEVRDGLLLLLADHSLLGFAHGVVDGRLLAAHALVEGVVGLNVLQVRVHLVFEL